MSKHKRNETNKIHERKIYQEIAPNRTIFSLFVLPLDFKSLAVYFYSVFLQSLDVCIAAQSTIWNHQYYVQYFVLLRISTFKKIDSRRLGALHLFLLEIRENLSVILDYFFTLFESAVIQFTRMFFPIYKSKSKS